LVDDGKKNLKNQKNAYLNLLVDVNAQIIDAIRILNETGLRIVIVVNNDNSFIGTISDGDIRRGILNGLTLNSSIKDITNRKAFSVLPDTSPGEIREIMHRNKIQQVPIVDEYNVVTGLHTWDDLENSSIRSNLVVIMAGGLGSRLSPETDECPKPLLKIGNKPILEHIIESAKQDGFNTFLLAVYHLGHMIESYFGNGSKWGVEISYIREKSPLGTAGALSLLDVKPVDPILVLNGDVITDVNLSKMLDFHESNSAAGTMAVKLNEFVSPFGVVKTSGIDIIGYEEKPVIRDAVNAGVYILNPEVIELLRPDEKQDMPSIFSLAMKANKKTIVFPIHENWIDVGTPEKLNQVREKKKIKLSPLEN